MDALKLLFSDPKGLTGIGLIIAATVLAALGLMTIAEWTSFSQWIFGIYAGSTALHLGLIGFGSGAAVTGAAPPAPAPAPAAPVGAALATGSTPTTGAK
jgi:hypothetical protein